MGLPRDLLPVALALAFFVPAPARAARELPLDHASLAQRPAPFVDPLHPLRSLATVTGSLFEDDREIGRAVLRVGTPSAPVHSLVTLLRTVRPR